ncbi:tRNA (adenosine(37)-N6)-threonylcarbamoyltransferase complex dimerization subunit type 1 TsaB [Flavobacterium salilacus subsp. salilacus]|uniref:tRNA (adenosine(37)-N6)-threonylcarbamoyltransferase complex dimerization subunit type 1 TsaB n=1 Tax=Flavobacterium TaxID=237 RepID=UPI0010749FF9|nr:MULTISPECIES: tRNA (adenosine(37)-N6)-threonylcarbamoyltransferase complex dimerization subunit type 1 TsaB [Flavobacterium]KAF2519991.1 tRNA (adenosine(37)-N6)-threonylcarbamoyltransferase complex dimerization subunit type 1 TsaB [Flavobacterium salilacus subsp. salilacus]MBE1614095.1 tRNA (adenosine(37)-N6)-threonylcarbamoyltransferase complex dimerization subunit type 1 TsaB [Flavobacterium sp. SaA2.13]
MGFILNIETATKNCSVSLAQAGNVVAIKEFAGEGYSHAEKLHVFIEEVLKEAGTTFSALDAVAVSMGPGSYTGLRIGVSAAKGLCYALHIPLLAIDTLEILARRVKITEGFVIPMIDARRMEVYSAVFDANYNKVRDTKAEIITGDSFSEYTGICHLAGDGIEKCRELLPEGNFVYHSDVTFPSSAEMAVLSYDKHQKSDTVDVAYFEPFYLKNFVMNR